MFKEIIAISKNYAIVKIDNVITEKDICITFVKSNTYCYFTNSEKKKLLLK